MRGQPEHQLTMVTFDDLDLDSRIPATHPLRIIKTLTDEALAALSPQFDRIYAKVGRPSIPPERLLKASLLIALYSVRSERAFCEELTYNLLFRWFMGHALMENRNGLLADIVVTPATGTAEREAAPQLVRAARERHFHPKTLGADKGYDTRDCVAALRAEGVTPHVTQHATGRRSAIDGRTTRHPGYAISQRIRKRVEEILGWMKTVGGLRRTRYRGVERTGLAAYLVGTAYNLVRVAGFAGEGRGACPGGQNLRDKAANLAHERTDTP